MHRDRKLIQKSVKRISLHANLFIRKFLFHFQETHRADHKESFKTVKDSGKHVFLTVLSTMQ